jgi:lipopolysaccharide transport system ATP-binding protein
VSDWIIKAEGLGKRYQIQHQSRERYTALRDVIANRIKGLLGRGNQSKGQTTTEEFWALQDVSFEIKQGEVVGIIGRNGAGKSTLLKILSRITEPTRGSVRLRGRVASLLEVGTGFHPELTGRENIFLNGAILGMSRAEIRSKFDEIVAFAEVEKFLDTPVKRYSSGMYVRLAFAVAAHLEPEILVVDEVLAVGDAGFQKKCLGKMQEVSRGGRTVLFVSHQMATMQNLCTHGILMAGGHTVFNGSIEEAVRRYLVESKSLATVTLDSRRDRQGTGSLRFLGFSLLDDDSRNIHSLTSGSRGNIRLQIANASGRSLKNVRIAVGIDNDAGARILVLSTHLSGIDFAELHPNITAAIIRFQRLTLAPGRYGFTLYASVNGEVADWIRNAGSFDVEAGDFYGTGQLPGADQGPLLMDHSFSIQAQANCSSEIELNS